jgi:peptide deformylase
VLAPGQELFKLINPVIEEESEETYLDEEGCLSIPGETAKVERAEAITVRALNPAGEEVTVEGKGLLARVLQHEIDHLNGELFIDKTI